MRCFITVLYLASNITQKEVDTAAKQLAVAMQGLDDNPAQRAWSYTRWPGGTLVLSWHDVLEGNRLPSDGHNLVFHLIRSAETS